MLKKILASLALIVGIIHPSMASEEIVFATEFPCISLEQLSSILERHKEEPFLHGTSSREIAGKIVSIPMVIFVNPQTKTWTLIEKYGKDIYCAAGLGRKISPYLGDNKKEFNH